MSSDHPKNWGGPHCLHQKRACPIFSSGFQSCKTLGAHWLWGPGSPRDGRLSWPRRDAPCGYLSSQRRADPYSHSFSCTCRKIAQFLPLNPDEQTGLFIISLKHHIKIAIYLSAGDEYNYIPPAGFVVLSFFFPKGKSIFHCRKACPSFRDASSCQERKAEDWQRKDTAKVLPEHCTKKIILRCWPLTEVCIIKEKNSNIMSWLFPKWKNCIRCNVSWEPAVIFFLWFFLQNKKSGMFRGWSPYFWISCSSFFPPPWPYSGLVLSNCFGLIICKGMVQLY